MRTAAAIISLTLLAALPAQAEALRRLAVIVGNDDGGEGTRPLVYARDDAKKIHDIFLRLGGVRSDDAELVLNGSAADMLAALARAERKAKEASQRGERTALLVYYSGHAKDGALRLGDTRIPLDALKERLARAPADVRIGIFDSCKSGQLTRTKGARKAPAFEIDSGAARAAKGLIILTSSTSDEDSQESDQVGGSYFSHHLASGLLGDADHSGDGRVSLSEAYQYAYDRTVADTSDSAAGAQHPTFSYDLAGNGELALTDVAARTEGVLFPASAPSGTYYVVDPRGFVAAEVWKAEQAERRIAVPAGTYRIKRRLADRLRIAELTVIGGQVTLVDERRFRDAPFSDDPVKGASRDISARVDVGFFGGYQVFFDSPKGGYFASLPLWGVEAYWRNYLRRDWALGLDLALGNSTSNLVLPTVTVRQTSSELTLGSTVLTEWPMGNVVPFAGVRLGMLFNTRKLPDMPAAQINLTWSPGLVLGARLKLGRSWSLVARSRVHYVLLVALDEKRSLGYCELGGLISYAF